MTNANLISPTDIRDYAKFKGWTVVPEALDDRLFVFNSPTEKYRQLIVPMDSDRPDFRSAINIAIERLSEEELRSKEEVEASLLEADSDTWRFGVSTSRGGDEGLPLSYASRAVKGVENAFRAAACSVVNRQPYHPRMNRVEAQKLIEAAQLRHTEFGSFVLKVACPLNAISADIDPIEPAGQPFVRRAMLGMSEAISSLVKALEEDTLDRLVEQASTEGSPLSANLCDGILSFRDEDFRTNLNLSVNWSPRLPVFGPMARAKVRIQWDYFARIEQVKTALRPSREAQDETFVGSVEELRGDLSGESRSGEVILDLLIEGETVKARASLTRAQHAAAIEAYKAGRAYIRVSGRLHPGNQPRLLSNISEFSLIDTE